jgi:hypothetical protein
VDHANRVVCTLAARFGLAETALMNRLVQAEGLTIRLGRDAETRPATCPTEMLVVFPTTHDNCNYRGPFPGSRSGLWALLDHSELMFPASSTVVVGR